MAGKQSGHRIASIVLGILILAVGISVCILIDQIFKVAVENVATELTSDSDGLFAMENPQSITKAAYSAFNWIWIFGLLYVIPGITGFISGATGAKAAYITHMVLEIIALVIAGIIVIFMFAIGISAVQLESMTDKCQTMDGVCKCSSDFSSAFTASGFADCDKMHVMISLSQAFVSLFIIGWILALGDVIHAGIAGCCRSEQTPGVIMYPQQPNQVIMVNPNMMMAPVPGGGQTMVSSDRAILVNNTY